MSKQVWVVIAEDYVFEATHATLALVERDDLDDYDVDVLYANEVLERAKRRFKVTEAIENMELRN